MGHDTRAAQYEDTVQPEWIDDNDHMNLAFYVLVFTRATAAFSAGLGLALGWRVTQMHTAYQREVKLGDRLRVATHLIGAGDSALHLLHEMFHADAGYRAATLEMAVQYEGELPEAAVRRIAAMVVRVQPDMAGRRVAMGARTSENSKS